ncbi:NAD(P)-binding protein [Punctularia strigosozonata HHB-11173 SS5]|uniref:NAD(P)-binding protein n=1 Tax=Punctularia strigosozonata (strain HHB-11173) TaxID=741275 RepID=UPI0004416A10|nr:NAD(P)-binding protein [Punctularia strigosozonata HHB-11173 SS5]EIN10398.1 NAD(P)-binding protein [Punctularia strigosozonata HHB-11173 SS5]
MEASAIRHSNHPVPFSRPASSASHHPRQIGFIGLGNMGYFMARNLARSAHSRPPGSPPLVVWNRTEARAYKLRDELGENRVRVADSAEELVRECEIVITNLPNDEAVKSVYGSFAAVLEEAGSSSGKIFVETSTTYPTTASDLEALLSALPRAHASLVTCPVFGLPPVADRAQLLVAVSGPYGARKEVAHLIVPAMARKVIDLGENPEKAPTSKLVANSMVMGMAEVMAEAFTMAEKTGIGAGTVYDLVKEVLPAPPMIMYGEKMLHDRFDGTKGFAIDGGIKDSSYIRNLAAQHGAPMAAIDVSHNHFLTARSVHAAATRQGGTPWEVLDASAIVVGSRVGAGLDAFKGLSDTAMVLREDQGAL